MLLQFLLIVRLVMPSVHVLLHGKADKRDGKSTALCSISDQAASSKEPQQSSKSAQISIADMLPSDMWSLNLGASTFSPVEYLPTFAAAVPIRALPDSTPPPKHYNLS